SHDYTDPGNDEKKELSRQGGCLMKVYLIGLLVLTVFLAVPAPAPGQQEEIDVRRAQELRAKQQRGETLTPEEAAYLRRALEWRRRHTEAFKRANPPRRGPVRSPWLAWGPYLWSDGIRGRSDGLVYTRDDLASDGTHPSMSGREKVAKLLLRFLKQEPTARLWFVKNKAAHAKEMVWKRLSSANGNLPVPGESVEQTACLVLDIDQDGVNDLVIGARRRAPSMVWLRRDSDGWDRYLIDKDLLPIEAGGAFHDIDRDGDLDIVMGEDATGNHLYWWENPYPHYDTSTPWTRHIIKNSGANKHHDQIFGDFDGDGKTELVFWNQRAKALFIADIPSDSKTTSPWSYKKVYSWNSDGEHEGLAQADIDGDGKTDIIGGGRWFEHSRQMSYTAHIIDDVQRFTRAAAGQLKEGGPPEVVFVIGDGVGRLKWYECRGNPAESSSWVAHDLLGFDVQHGHSLQLADMNNDGNLDIFCGEMGQWSRDKVDNPEARMWIFLGDGDGNFQKREISRGQGVHEGKTADLDGDKDIDILVKPYRHNTPRLDILMATASSSN
ncbi:VCBS repeat-containing protein, partial [Acidobacteria bacterium AH-259-A15]|nr:VCBS repeat-containing protein [Acidobacteria bacterium AH-259-A15]